MYSILGLNQRKQERISFSISVCSFLMTGEQKPLQCAQETETETGAGLFIIATGFKYSELWASDGSKKEFLHDSGGRVGYGTLHRNYRNPCAIPFHWPWVPAE